jgi:endonuclease YncB( thermonuclease family)
MNRVAILLLLIVLLPSPAVSADSVAGVASVIDGDTIEIHGERVRLFGIDAPRYLRGVDPPQSDFLGGQNGGCTLVSGHWFQAFMRQRYSFLADWKWNSAMYLIALPLRGCAKTRQAK